MIRNGVRVRVVLFEAVEDGYLVAFDLAGPTITTVVRAIGALNPWQRHWIAAEQAWWIADDAITLLARQLPAVEEALGQWRTRREESAEPPLSSAWLPPPRQVRRIPSEVVAAYIRLGLAPGAQANEVTAARRALARRAHPDTGGDHEEMVAINRATDVVLTWLSRTGEPATVVST